MGRVLAAKMPGRAQDCIKTEKDKSPRLRGRPGPRRHIAAMTASICRLLPPIRAPKSDSAARGRSIPTRGQCGSGTGCVTCSGCQARRPTIHKRSDKEITPINLRVFPATATTARLIRPFSLSVGSGAVAIVRPAPPALGQGIGPSAPTGTYSRVVRCTTKKDNWSYVFCGGWLTMYTRGVSGVRWAPLH